MAHQDRLYYFDELIGSGTCSSKHSVSPIEVLRMCDEVDSENAERNDMEDVYNDVMKGLDTLYSDKGIPVSEFMTNVRASDIPLSGKVRDTIEIYKSNSDTEPKLKESLNKATKDWLKREIAIENKHKKEAEKYNIGIVEYRRGLQQAEAESPKAVAEAKQQAKETKEAKEAAEAAARAAEIERRKAIVNRSRGRS